MELFLDCLPCVLKQVLEAARMATNDERIQEDIMNEALQVLSGYREYQNTPKMAETMHGIVKRRTRVADPYAKIKSRDIMEALRLEPLIEEFIIEGKEALLQAIKVSATGNIMDSAIYSNLDMESCLMEELKKPFVISDADNFIQDLKGAKQILIIGDNAGEAVFDKVLAKHLSADYEVIFAVREEAIINDATIDDANEAGVSNFARVVSTGCKAPGTVLESCSTEFKDIFEHADIVISKGQGNFEGLSDSTRKVYFLLKAKCPRVAKVLGVQVGDYIFKG